jgi:D-serine deaminase-like pyridoxal phosphate-dependent protein
VHHCGYEYIDGFVMQMIDMETPSLLVDEYQLDKNIASMATHIAELAVTIRPHVKTTKCPDIARKAFGGEIGPITVSTLQEAEYFSKAGFKDILYAVSVIPQKLTRIQALQKRGALVTVILDNLDVAKTIIDQVSDQSPALHVLIEIDADGHRAGIVPEDPVLLPLATCLNEASGIVFDGIMTHAGESYNCRGATELRAHADLERDAVLKVKERLTIAGLPCSVISVGSTPTAVFATDLQGVTEVRAGVYMFMDLFQAGLGVCSYDDIALSVLTTVISHRKDQNRIIVDAGGLALSKDRGTQGQKRDCKFGLVCDANGKLIEDLIVEAANQEHGMITSSKGQIDFEHYKIGSRLRILPNHACMTAAAHSKYHVVSTSGDIDRIWDRCNGW